MLEAHLGVTLVARNGGKISLTEEGTALARELTAGFTTIRRGIDALTGADAFRPVQITTTPAFAVMWLMSRIVDFQNQHPGVTLLLNPTSEIVELKPGGIDLAIRYRENNAAVWLEIPSASSPPLPEGTSALSIDILRQTFEANFFAPVQLTQKLLPLIRKSAAGRIVNVSSILGSLTRHCDPASTIYDLKVFAYDASKTALNAFTVHLAHELRDTSIKVNSIHPGWVRTEMGGADALLDTADGCRTAVRMACLSEDGPTGGFFSENGTLPW